MNWHPHCCPTCNQRCKSPPGSGAQVALQWKKIRPANRKCLLVLVNHAADGPLDEDRIRHYAALEYKFRTTANAIHNRLSELVTWKLIQRVDIPNSASKSGTAYDHKKQNVAAYKANLERANIVINDDWSTARLWLFDNFLDRTS